MNKKLVQIIINRTTFQNKSISGLKINMKQSMKKSIMQSHISQVTERALYFTNP